MNPWVWGCIFIMLSSTAGWANIPQAERDALLAFYSSTQGDGWTNRTGWLGDPGTEPGWFGVTCDEANTHVIGIELPSNNLTGYIPPQIGDFPQLQTLVLTWNGLSGSVPTGVT